MNSKYIFKPAQCPHDLHAPIENVKDHSLPPALGTLFVVCQREDPTKTQSVNEQLDLSLLLRLNFAGQ